MIASCAGGTTELYANVSLNTTSFRKVTASSADKLVLLPRVQYLAYSVAS